MDGVGEDVADGGATPLTTTTPDPELTITLGEIRRRITVLVRAVDWHVGTAPDGTRQIVVVTEDLEDGRRGVVPMTQFRAWPLVMPAWADVDAARLAVEAFYRDNTVPAGGKAELAHHLATLAAWYGAPDLEDDLAARVMVEAADAAFALVYDPDGIALVVNPDELTVIAERAEAGWGNLR